MLDVLGSYVVANSFLAAFGDAAAICLDVYSEPKTATSKLCSLIAYYPTSIPDTRHRFTSSFRVLVHLAEGTSGNESTVGVTRRPEVLGIQGKRRTVQKRITPGIGAGGLQDRIVYPVFTYEGVEPGFAEHDLDEYDAVADAIAWSRSLSMVRRGFSAEVDLERVWEENEERTSPTLLSYRIPTWLMRQTNTVQKDTAERTSRSSSEPTLRKAQHHL